MNIPDGWPTEKMIDAGEMVDPNDHASKGSWVQAVLAAALAAAPTPPAQEDDPVAVRDNANKNGIRWLTVDFPEEGLLLYTRPSSDELRKAAEEILAIADGKGRTDMYERTIEKLRAALERK